jgi:hypothetical protein
MKDNNNNNNKYPDYSSNPPLPASYIQNDNNNIHPLDDLNKFNSKPISQSVNVNPNLEKPYQSGNFSNNNNNNNIPYQAGNLSNSNNNIPYQAGNMQYQYQTPTQFQQQQIPIQPQQIPIQPQQIPIPQQQIPIQPQQIPIQPQVTYINPQPVVMSQPTYISVPNVQYGVCPYCGGSGISFQTGLRCHCVGGMSQGDMFALGVGLGMMGPRYGYRRPFFYP